MSFSGNFEDLIVYDTRANQPAAGIAGRLHFVSDEPGVVERDNGASWAALPIGRAFIEELTPSATDTASFTSLPATFKKLVFEFAARGTQAATSVGMSIQLNGDTTATNYRHATGFSYAATSTGADGGATPNIAAVISAASSPSGSFSVGKIEIIQYANTNFNTQVLYTVGHRRDDSSVYEMEVHGAMEWESTSAVSQVDFILDAGNYAANSVFRAYGEY